MTHIQNINFHGVCIYNPWKLISGNYDILVLMLHQAHITTWLLLLTKFVHQKKIVLWGQGMSNKRYLKEIKRPSILLKWMIGLSNGAWIYMSKEKDVWKSIYPEKPITALGNTIGDVKYMLTYSPIVPIENLKKIWRNRTDCVYLLCKIQYCI